MSCAICHHPAADHMTWGCIRCNCAGSRDWRLDNYEVQP